MKYEHGNPRTRELTRKEKTAIRKLVTRMCANYDKEYGCLPLDCACYMLNKSWTGAYCKYFISAVLPLDPALEVSLKGNGVMGLRHCASCGTSFPANGRKAYCSKVCADKAIREQKRDYIRNRRSHM